MNAKQPFNFFTLFNLPSQFKVDKRALDEAYHQAQKKYHPDNFVTENDNVKASMAQESSRINDAYRALKSPSERAQHVLDINGIEFEFDTATVSDTEFLMQQMELREQLERIVEQKDLDRLEALEHDMQAELKRLEEEVANTLEGLTVVDGESLIAYVAKMQFMQKLLVEINHYFDELDDV